MKSGKGKMQRMARGRKQGEGEETNNGNKKGIGKVNMWRRHEARNTYAKWLVPVENRCARTVIRAMARAEEG